MLSSSHKVKKREAIEREQPWAPTARHLVRLSLSLGGWPLPSDSGRQANGKERRRVRLMLLWNEERGREKEVVVVVAVVVAVGWVDGPRWRPHAEKNRNCLFLLFCLFVPLDRVDTAVESAADGVQRTFASICFFSFRGPANRTARLCHRMKRVALAVGHSSCWLVGSRQIFPAVCPSVEG